MPRNRSTVSLGNPALAAETAICTVGNMSVPVGTPIDFNLAVDLTIGTSGTAVVARLRRGGDTTGVAVFTSSAFTVVAANHVALSFYATDVQPGEYQNGSYTLTVQVTAGAAQTTVNNVYLGAIW